MMQRWRRLLAVIVVLGVLTISAEVTTEQPAVAGGAVGCTTPWWPTSGALSTYHVQNGDYETSFSFVLSKSQRDNLQCVAPWLEIDFHIHGFLVPGEWDHYIVYDTNLPSAIHDTAASDLFPLQAPWESTPGVTRIDTSQLEYGKTYYVTLVWPGESQVSYPYNVMPVPGITQSVSITWVPSYWAKWDNPDASLDKKIFCSAVGGWGDAWCIFPYKDAAADLHDQVTGLIGGRLPFGSGAQQQRFGDWAGNPIPSVPSLPMLSASFNFLAYLPPLPVTTNPLGPDFNHDGTPDIWAFNKHDVGSGKTVYFILDGRDPTQTLRVGATAFGWLDDNFSIAVGPDWNGDAIPDIYAFNRHDAGSGKTVYFVLNGNAPDQFLQIGATPFGFTDTNWSFSPGPDFNHDGHPDLYAFNRQDPGTSATVYYVLDGTNPEHQLQVGRTPFGYTNAGWSFSAGADWNHDGTPDLYAFNKHDVGSGHTVYYVLDGTNPQHQLQVGATAFGFTDANYSFTPGPDFNHDGTPDFYGFNKQDSGTGKTVYFVLNGTAPDQFLQIGATAMSATDANWDFGVVGG